MGEIGTVSTSPWSRLGLGTVQFGIPYGIANTSGQVAYSEVLHILDRSVASGVTFIDTARAYGSSEKSLGLAMAELRIRDRLTVCTKLDISKDYADKTDDAVLEEVTGALESSREALALESIPVYQLHVPDHRTFRAGIIWQALERWRSDGTIGLLGVSMAGSDVAASLACVNDPSVEVIQIPYNALDQRWRRSGLLEAASQRGVRVIGRSAYLQGLLVMPEERLPASLGEALPWKRRFSSLAAEAGIGDAELALRYALTAPEISSTIVGVDSIRQLETNLAVAEKGPLPADLVARIESEFAEVPERLVVPSRWT